MEFLLDPNVAYLVLVVGMMIAILAMLAPGTGLLEVVGFGLLLVAGYQIASLPINFWALGVLILGIFPFIFAVRKSKKWYFILISIGAMIIGSLFLFTDQTGRPVVNPVLAAAMSVAVVGFFWLIVSKGMKAVSMKPSHALSDLVGSIGETRTPVHKYGSVYAAGENWSAWSKEPIPENTRVKIVSRDGFLLEVEKIE